MTPNGACIGKHNAPGRKRSEIMTEAELQRRVLDGMLSFPTTQSWQLPVWGF